MRKSQKYLSLSFLILLGMLYFTFISQYELHPFLKNQLAIIPIQIGALIYWWRWRNRKFLKKLD